MALVQCEVSDGLRDAEATVTIMSYAGRPEYLPVDRGFLRHEGENHYLPVAVIHTDEAKGAILIALPVEADSGAYRIWVKKAILRSTGGVPV
jgi:hypothetical protein